MDITYIPMARGFVYLVGVLDWHSRKVLAHRVSITMEADFCIEALHKAISRNSAPEIGNTPGQPVHKRSVDAGSAEAIFRW